MTTQVISRFIGLLGSVLIVANSFGQESSMKNVQTVLPNSNYVKVYENVQTEFQKYFSKAEDVQWYSVGKDYLAKFSIADQEYRALLDRKGNLLYKISYGKEKHLPTDIRKWVKSIYVEFAITQASLVEEGGRRLWIINLADNTYYAVVKIEDNEMEEISKYQRADGEMLNKP